MNTLTPSFVPSWTASAPFVIRVALLTADGSLRESLAGALTPFGFEVIAVDSPVALTGLLATRVVDLCVLHAGTAPDAVLTMVAWLRARSAVGLVVATDAPGTDVRIHALLAGADVCVNLPMSARELAAVVLGISRRLGSTRPAVAAAAAPAPDRAVDHLPPGAPRAWWLTGDDWELIAPSGTRLDLSQGERCLLSCFAQSPGQVLTRDAIAGALDGAARVAPAIESRTHRISMVVSRLRKKADRAGARLPLRAVRGSGYEFYERLARATPTGAAPAPVLPSYGSAPAIA